MADFKDRLKKLRIENNLTQSDLALELDISRSTIGMYETGKREADYETLEAIADFFNVDMNYLTGWSDEATDWEKLGNENGIHPPKDFDGTYIDYVKAKMIDDHDEFLDDYWDTRDKVIKHLTSQGYKIINCEQPNELLIISPLGKKVMISEGTLISNFKLFGFSKYNTKNILNPNSLLRLTKNEEKVIDTYRSLNEEGKQEAIKRLDELTMIPRYTEQEQSEPLLNAAHANPNATKEDMQHDDDIMDDENF